MNYELAKKLMDKGFPHSELWYEDEGYMRDRLGLITPTLSELIEACGENLIAIQRHEEYDYAEHTTKTDGWDAVKKWVDYYPPEVEIGAKGQTPEEAVANLWLELNK